LVIKTSLNFMCQSVVYDLYKDDVKISEQTGVTLVNLNDIT
jgi:hypothetical protein